MKKITKLNSKSASLLADFDEHARSWGWQSDQGTGHAVERSERYYNEAKIALIAHIASLEEKIRNLKNPDRLNRDVFEYTMEPGKVMI